MRCDFAFLLAVCSVCFYSPDFILPGDTVVASEPAALAGSGSATKTTYLDMHAPIIIFGYEYCLRHQTQEAAR